MATRIVWYYININRWFSAALCACQRVPSLSRAVKVVTPVGSFQPRPRAWSISIPPKIPCRICRFNKPFQVLRMGSMEWNLIPASQNGPKTQKKLQQVFWRTAEASIFAERFLKDRYEVPGAWFRESSPLLGVEKLITLPLDLSNFSLLFGVFRGAL